MNMKSFRLSYSQKTATAVLLAMILNRKIQNAAPSVFDIAAKAGR